MAIKKKYLFLLLILIPGCCFAQAAVVDVVTDTSPSFLSGLVYQAETLGNVISTLQNTIAAVENQKLALESLDDLDLENFAEFMNMQSKSTAALNTSLAGYRSSAALLQYAGSGKTKSSDIYDQIVANSDKETAQMELSQSLSSISDSSYNTAQMITDINRYETKSENRMQQYRQIKRDAKTVGQLQTVNQLLGLLADQNEDQIQLLQSRNFYQGQQQKLDLQRQEYERAKDQARAEQDGAVPNNFGQLLMGSQPIDIHANVRQQRLEYDRIDGSGYGY